MRQGGLVRRFGVVRSGLATLVAVCVGVLGLGVVPAGAQTGSIALSFTDTSDATLTSVGEDGGAQTVRLVATAAAAPSSAVTVTITVGGTGSTATSGLCALGSCSGDYTTITNVSVTIASGATTGHTDVSVSPNSDTVTEDHEIIKFTGTATGYTVTGADLAITDADRTITLTFNNNIFEEARGDSGTVAPITDRTITATMSGATSTYSTGINRPLSFHHITTQPSWENYETSANPPDAIDWSHTTDNPVAQPQIPRYIIIAAGATSDVASNNIQSTTELRFTLEGRNRKAAPDRTFEIRATIPGFTVVPAVGIVRDTDTDIAFSVSPSAVLAEGENGSGLTVSASYVSKPTGSPPNESYIGRSIDITVGVSGGVG